MMKIVLFSLVLHLLVQFSTAQNSPSATTTSVAWTPEMSASAVSSLYAALATSASQQPGTGPGAGDVGSSSSDAGDSTAGASGADTGSISLSKGGIIAIIVVACTVCIFGAVSAVLWYLAKKRSWQIRESIRRSARKVATALTPRRSTFPKDVHSRSTRGLTRIDEMPNTPRTKNTDIEKAHPKVSDSFEMAEPPKQSRWARKNGR